MSGKACALCLRDECERCHDPNCLCCGTSSFTANWWERADDDVDYDDGPVTL